MSEYPEEIAAEVELEQEPVDLCNLLQILDLADSGGQAKMLISEGYVALNNEICLQKRKKVYGGDLLNFGGQLFQILLAEGGTRIEPTPKTKQQKQAAKTASQPKNKTKKSKQKTNTKSEPAKSKTTGRKPISFG